MHRLSKLIVGMGAAVALAITAVPVEAQSRGRAEPRVPKGHEPPPGMCRIWLEGVPAAQQPAPSDCATAIRKRPANAAVVFGEPVRNTRSGERTPPVVRRLNPEQHESPPPTTRRATSPREEKERAPAPRERTREAPPPRRTEREPAPTPPPAERRRRTPPSDGDYEELLASARWLDADLLAALYDPGRPDPRTIDPRADDGRATPRSRAGERGRSAVQPYDERELDWARTADGGYLSAWEVEQLLRYEQEVLLGGGMGGSGYIAGLKNDGLVSVRPGECYDRNFDGRCDDLSGGADGCYDTNRDGRCDDARWDAPRDRRPTYDPRDRRDPRYARGGAPSAGLCFDRDRDGRCDEPWSDGRGIPQTLPEMAAAAGLRRGVASYDVERWLRRTDLSARITDRDGDGLPERVIWLDARGQVVQVWTDRDGDGIADRVEIFRDGLPVQVVER